MDKQLQRLIKDLSLRYNIPEEEVIRINESQYELIAETIRMGKRDDPNGFLNCKLIHIGKLVVNPERIKRIIERKTKYHGTKMPPYLARKKV
jgi:hypothetical protein